MPTDNAQSQNSSIGCKFSLDPVEQILADNRVFVVIAYGNGPYVNPPIPRCVESGLVCLNQPDIKEVWYSDRPVEYGIEGDYYWARTESIILAVLQISEVSDIEFSQQIELQYKNLLEFLKSQGYPRLARVWNTMTDINQGAGDLERYKQFCKGRYQGFERAGYETQHFPAASALGSRNGKVVINAIACRTGCTHFENPQQLSAYCYPREYGPQSPSFARATFLETTDSGIVFLSGTASIIGHETQNHGDIEGQMSVMLDNLGKLTESITGALKLERQLKPDLLKVYLRNSDDLELVQQRIRGHFGSQLPVAYLHADICRADLLVEAEGICHL
ncbi:MAG: hypothetical protein JXA04_04005 [Gammaproteobacteria bacterium]|nr:hypothetical protein [Gammaproteobacteria bacterium]